MVGFQLNTKVLMADNTYKNIQDIQINDSVMSWDETNQCLVPQTVVNTFSETCNELTIYTFDNGDVLYGCENLVFLTTDGWKENIEIGDLVITKSGLPTALVDEEVLGQEIVYELDIEDIDNYIVENIVVHNAIIMFRVYNQSGTLQQTFTKSNTTGVLISVANDGSFEFTSGTIQTYTPSTTIDGYSSTQGGARSYYPGNNYTWTSAMNWYEHNATVTTYGAKIQATTLASNTAGYIWTSTTASGIKTYLGQLTNTTISLNYTRNTSGSVWFWISTSSSTYTAPTLYSITGQSSGSSGTITSDAKGIYCTLTSGGYTSVYPQITYIGYDYIIKTDSSLNKTLYVYYSSSSTTTWTYVGTLSTSNLSIQDLSTTISIRFSSTNTGVTNQEYYQIYSVTGCTKINDYSVNMSSGNTGVVTFSRYYKYKVNSAADYSSAYGSIYLFNTGSSTIFGILEETGNDGTIGLTSQGLTIGLSSSDSTYTPVTNCKISSITGGTKITDTTFVMTKSDNDGNYQSAVVTLAQAVTNPPIYIGTDQISKIYIGSSKVDSIYIGTNKVY